MKATGGFTLLELLIGLTLFGFVLALLLGGFRLASTSWDAVASRTEASANTQLGRNFMRHLLSQLQPLRWKKAMNQPIAFNGERGSLQAIAALPSRWNSGGLQVIELSAQADEQSQGLLRLVLRHAALRRDSEQFIDSLDNAGEGHVVLDGLIAVEFGYFGSEKVDDPPRWQDHWGNPQQLPQLISVRTTSNEGGWADLIIAPMLGNVGCRWDSASNRCL